ncbi:MAG: secondary thiamine-phosphate synthase enzyme YjbQ [Anaerovoracaceae bacterium]|jgi:secondary thiamine-phosphate synthase enzyme
MNLITITVRTEEHTQMKDVTEVIRRVVRESGVKDGFVIVFAPHTTAGITINENADPDVTRDFMMELSKIVPWEDGYRHGEGNSAAHLKSSLTGCSETILIEDGDLVLGMWQGIYFTEYDGPRTRRLHLKIVETE